MAVSRSKYYVLPNTTTGYHTLAAGGAVMSDGTGLNLTGYEKIFVVSANGSVKVMPQHNPTSTGDFWVDLQELEWSFDNETKIFRLDDEIEGDIRVVITSQETVDSQKVKVRIDQYTVTGTYITLPQYRALTKISYTTVGDDVLAYYIDMAHQDVIRGVGSDKTSSDTFWRTIQQAEAMLATHYGVINGWEIVPIDKTAANEISSQWKEQYRELMVKLSGQDPFQDIEDMQRLDGVYESKVTTITPDEDSYVQSTQR